MAKVKDMSIKAGKLREKGHLWADRGPVDKAFRFYLKAAELGDEESQVRVGYGYAYGWGCEFDAEKAIAWWKRAYRKGSWDAAFNLGMFYRDAKEWKKALRWFERAVELGDEDGWVEIAAIHFRYHGDRAPGLRALKSASAIVDKLTHPARQALERIRQEQEAKSSGELLYMEAELLDDEGRYREAYPLLLKGAEAGDDSCQILLANYLSDGRKGIAKDEERAIFWYKAAYEQGSSIAASNLALHFRKKDNIEEAYRWFERSIEAGNRDAHLNLARIWLHDRGNSVKAIEHLQAIFEGNLRDVSEGDRDEARALLRRLLNKAS